MTLLAEGARRNSSRADLYSRVGDFGFLRTDGIVRLLAAKYGVTPCISTGRGMPVAIATNSQQSLNPPATIIPPAPHPAAPPPRRPLHGFARRTHDDCGLVVDRRQADAWGDHCADARRHRALARREPAG